MKVYFNSIIFLSFFLLYIFLNYLRSRTEVDLKKRLYKLIKIIEKENED